MSSIGIPITADNAADVAKVQAAFAKPFPDSEVKVKPAMVKGNRCLALHYIDARCVMDKLDEVVGIDGWRDEYTVLPGGNEVECRLSVKFGGTWITKADVGGQSEQPDEGDRMKAAYSDALKRAAVKFGIGRFLYRLPQQWLDYDPVKKQVIRPKPQQPAPQQSQQKPAAPQPSTTELRADFVAWFKDADSRDRVSSLMADVGEAKKNSDLTQADCDFLRPIAEAALKRFPQPAPKTSKA